MDWFLSLREFNEWRDTNLGCIKNKGESGIAVRFSEQIFQADSPKIKPEVFLA